MTPHNSAPGAPAATETLIRFADLRLPQRYAEERSVWMEYDEPDGSRVMGQIALTCAGQGCGGYEYLGGYDAGQFRVFRADRIHRVLML